MKKHSFFNRFLFLFSIVLSFSFFYSCASKSDKVESYKITTNSVEPNKESLTEDSNISQLAEETNNQSEIKNNSENYGENTLISALPTIPKKTTYFEFINKGALLDAQMGSPKYIQNAVELLKKTGNEYSEEEGILFSIFDIIMTTLWPAEVNSIQIPKVYSNVLSMPETVYTGIITYIKNGMYDANAGDSDFFTLILPSLVIATSSQTSFYQDAQNSLSRAFEINANSTILNYLQGLLYSKQGLFTEALPFLRNANSSDPTCKEIALLYIKTMYECKNFLPAYNLATTLLINDISDSQLLKLCAELALTLNYLDEAESYVGRLLQQDSNNGENILLRAKILFQKQDYLKTSSLLDAYAKANKTSMEYLLLRSALQQKWNKNSLAAIATVAEALSLYPTNEEVLIFAAELAIETGSEIEGKVAFDFIENIQETDTNRIQLLKIHIAEYKREKRWQHAYTKLNELLVLEDTLENNLDLVSLCLELSMNSRAMDLITTLYKQNMDNEAVQQLYIKALVANGKKTDAQELIEKLLKSATSKMKSFLYFQRSLLAPNDDKKLADLRSCLTANPRNQEALFSLYELYFNKNDYRKAQYYIKQAIALNPNDETLLRLNSELDAYLR